jgi:putative flippase GtrA
MENKGNRGFLFQLTSNTMAALLFVVILVGVASVLSLGFGLDRTIAAGIGLACWYPVRFFIKRQLKNQGATPEQNQAQK